MVLTEGLLTDELFRKDQPWLKKYAPSSRERSSTWNYPENRRNAMRWIYWVYCHKTEVGVLDEKWQVHDITDLTQPHITNDEILGKTFRSLLSYKSFPELMMEAFSTEFSYRFEGVFRPWMTKVYLHWDPQSRREMTQATCRHVAETRPLFLTEKKDFMENNPFGHSYTGILKQVQRRYGHCSHWALLAEASILISDDTKPIHPLSFTYSSARDNISRRFSLKEDDVDRIAQQAKAELANLPQRRERILGLYLQGYTLQEIGWIFGVTRERIRQILDDPNDSYLRLTPEERNTHQAVQEKITNLKLEALHKRGFDSSARTYADGTINALYYRLNRAKRNMHTAMQLQ